MASKRKLYTDADLSEAVSLYMEGKKMSLVREIYPNVPKRNFCTFCYFVFFCYILLYFVSLTMVVDTEQQLKTLFERGARGSCCCCYCCY